MADFIVYCENCQGVGCEECQHAPSIPVYDDHMPYDKRYEDVSTVKLAQRRFYEEANLIGLMKS
jgi:hypothetical protein